jgi:hypothetical protein
MKTTQLIAQAPWHKVMAELRGDRLAFYDDAMRVGRMTELRPQDFEASRWLQYHQLIWQDDLDGYWIARTTEQARTLWETKGPCARAAKRRLPEEGETEGRREGEAPRTPEGDRKLAAVQAHQVQFFDMEGYRT